MFWSTLNVKRAGKLVLPTFLRKAKTVAFFESLLSPMQIIVDETLYKMQHTGKKIDLEKMLNESYGVIGYDPQNHEDTKLIYIDDIPEVEKLYIWQNEEPGISFLEDDDDDNEDDTFLDGDGDNVVSYSWIIFMPDTIAFTEITLRALVDNYRYVGKKYTVEIYTP